MVTRAVHLSKEQALTLINDFFAQFPIWCNQDKAPTVADLEQFLAHNFQISCNDRVIAKNTTEYLKRVKNMREKFSNFELIGPLEEPLVHDNKLVCQYDLNVHANDGIKVEVCFMAIATIEGNKIVRWQEVSHEKHTGKYWDVK